MIPALAARRIMMTFTTRWPRMIAWALALSCGLSVAQSPDSAQESLRLDRLVAVAKLWAAVKYFHPYLAYRDDIDWDAALVKAIPKVNAARNGADYSAAVAAMLSELGDPATRVLSTPPPATTSPVSKEPQSFFRMTPDGILLLTLTNYTGFQDFTGTTKKLAAVKAEIPKARAIVFDLRPTAPPTEDEQGLVAYAIAQNRLEDMLTSTPLAVPGERRRMHIGYVPQDGSSSGDYSSGFYIRGAPSIKSAAGAKDIPVVFVLNAHADVPMAALALQAAGKAAIVAEGEASDELVVTTQVVHLPDGVQAQIRLGELVYEDGTTGFAPNLSLKVSNLAGEQNPAFQNAIELASKGKFDSPKRSPLTQKASPSRDKPYDDMQYPPAEYRVLAAIRLWAVIDYFFPYREFMGEDWDCVLRDFIPRLEQAKDALDYNLTISEMVTHFHDSHGFMRSPVLEAKFGNASLPIRVRMIEGLPVITGFTDSAAATAAGFEIGDVILKLDGEDAAHLIEQRLKYQAHSTPQSGLYYAAERSLVRGANGSTAKVTIRDIHDQVHEVKATRKAEYNSKTQGDRDGDILRILPGNIGYADLDRLPASQVDAMFDKFKDCPAIIFDDRGYPQGTAWQIAPRLTDKSDVVAALFKRRDPMAPNLPNGELVNPQVMETFLQRIPHTDKWRYHGPTVMLIDERTISQAEHTGLFFEAANGTKFVGSPTQGANGDVTNLSLPGGIYVHFSGQGVWHADGRQLQRLGLQPDVEARSTLAGIRGGKDEVLDKAIGYVTQTLKAQAKK
jgi:C-terminal processing protease CtpA/Prc